MAISKIIQKEKERQEDLNNSINFFLDCFNKLIERPPIEDVNSLRIMQEYREFHKQSLINLKEYMEGELKLFKKKVKGKSKFKEIQILKEQLKEMFDSKITQLKEDIKELNIMIERYG